MPFSTAPGGVERPRMGRRFRWLLAGTIGLVGLLALSQIWWFGLFRDWNAPEPPVVVPAGNPLPDYRALAEPPAPVVIERTVERAGEPVAPPVVPPPAAPPPVRVRAEERPRPVRLSRIDTGLAATGVELGWYRDGRRSKLGEGCALRPGTSIIPAKLVTAIDSEIPGQVIAETTSTVYSPDAGYENKPLVPAGTRIVGVVDKGQGLTLDRRRIDIAWSEMTSPSGFGGDRSVTQVALGRAYNASADGSAGSGGRVVMQYGQLFTFAALTTIFNIAQRPALDADNTVADVAQQEAGRTIGQVGNDITRRALDWEPKILVPAGTQVRILISETVRVCA